MYKIVLLAVILLVFLWIFLPSSKVYEHFNDEVIQTYEKTSTVRYSQSTQDSESTPDSTELMIMNRCIEFNVGSIENIISKLKEEFFISEKIIVNYVDFSTIQNALVTHLKSLHTLSNDIPQFLSPIYVLISQYPKYLNVSEDCTATPIPLSSHIDNEFLPLKVVHNNESVCKSTINDEIVCEIYILMPSHEKGINGKVGKAKDNVTWEDIKASMSLLLSDAQVINNRSQDSKCFTLCGTKVSDGNAYACGAKNGTTSSYISEVIKAGYNNLLTTTKIDVANLYVVNIDIMNSILCKNNTNCNEILKYTIDVGAIPSLAPRSIIGNSIPENRDMTEMTDAEAICYAKRYPYDLAGLSKSVLKKHWNDFGSINGYNKKCTIDVLPITDAELECYMYKNKLNNMTEARSKYFEEYEKGILPLIECAPPMNTVEADCYMNRYRATISSPDKAKTDWKERGYYEGKINSCHSNPNDNFYKSLTPEEAKCYKKNNSSIRYNTEMQLDEIRQHWLNGGPTAEKDKECRLPPVLTADEKDCYINRNNDLRNAPVPIIAVAHWNNYGFYENRKKDCDDGNINYRSLNENNEALCYKRSVKELRDNPNISFSEINKAYFNQFPLPNRNCPKIPRLSDDEKDCYINRNRNFDIKNAQKHYDELGYYIKLKYDCENGRYKTISDEEARCYIINNPTVLKQDTSLKDAKNHWYNKGSKQSLDKKCYSFENGTPCNDITCKYCKSGQSATVDGQRRCGSKLINTLPRNLEDGTPCALGTTCNSCKSGISNHYNGLDRCGKAPRNLEDGTPCALGTTCNLCKSGTSEYYNFLHRCGKAPRNLEDGTPCALGTSCNLCKSGISNHYNGLYRCGRPPPSQPKPPLITIFPPPPPKDLEDGTPCALGTSCNRCKSGTSDYYNFLHRCGRPPPRQPSPPKPRKPSPQKPRGRSPPKPSKPPAKTRQIRKRGGR